MNPVVISQHNPEKGPVYTFTVHYDLVVRHHALILCQNGQS